MQVMLLVKLFKLMVHGIDVDDLIEELNREEINTSADDSQDLY